MSASVSPHFTPLSLDDMFNARRHELPESLRTPERFADCFGLRTIRGMPFAFGDAECANVVLLDGEEVAIELGGAHATFVVFVHVVEDATGEHGEGTEDRRGAELGGLVSEYALEYEDGSSAAVAMLRRFAIQQARYGLAIAPLACRPALDDVVRQSPYEAHLLGRPVLGPHQQAAADEFDRDPGDDAPIPYAHSLTRSYPALVRGLMGTPPGLLWLYALPNEQPDRPLRRMICRPRGERSAIYAVTLTEVMEDPLRHWARRKARLRLPAGVQLNAAGEVDEIDIDLGTVISARVAVDYDLERWAGDEPIVEPSRSVREVLVEYAAHPRAHLHVGGTVHRLDEEESSSLTVVAPAHRPVRLRFVDVESSAEVAVRLHLHGTAGEYLPPRGHHRHVNRTFTQDHAAEFVNVENQYAYVDGECVVDLPLGTVYVEITRGYEFAPVRTSVEVGPDTDELTFELEKVLRWRERGWVTADTHVHFLTPQTALLEGRAEGVNVVNVLAAQWGETFSNVGDFDGRTTFGAEDLGGHGEFLVRVGSENRMPVLGHISLLGYSGELIQPLSSDGPGEAAFGDTLEVTMAAWAQRCIDQGGLVVLPHAPLLNFEGAADVVLGLIHALELMTVNPLHPDQIQLNRYGLADWYRYLNLGYQLPLVGGSDKMSAAMLLGGMRTYAQLGERELTYASWMDAIRAGNTFATVGPLAAVRVEGVAPGGHVRLPAGGGTVEVEWEVESVRLPVERVEVVAGGLVAEETTVGGELAARGRASVSVSGSSWIALRVRGSYHGRPDDVAAHTSAVQVLVDGSELFSEVDAMTVLDQIQGAITYVDTVVARPRARDFEALRATLESAYNRLHQRMHAAGVYHRHPLHDPGQPHEH